MRQVSAEKTELAERDKFRVEPVILMMERILNNP